MTPLFGRKKEPKEVFDDQIQKAKKLWESPKLWESSKYKKLLEHIEKAQEIAETVEVDQEDIVRLWSMKGSVFWMGYNRLDEALECYDKALSINPRDQQTLGNRMQVLYGLGKWDEFIKACEEELESIPERRGTEFVSTIPGVTTWDHYESRLWSQKGYALNRLTRVEEALKCYDKALGITPNEWAALDGKGLVLYHLGKYEEAMECISKSLEYHPKGSMQSEYTHGDVGTLLNKVRVLGTLAGHDLYDLSEHRPEKWALKESKVEKIHEEIVSCLMRAINIDSHEFLLNMDEVKKDWDSRGGLFTDCLICPKCDQIGAVRVAPLYINRKWEHWIGRTCPHMYVGRDKYASSWRGPYPIPL